jgi:hypothetical protein
MTKTTAEPTAAEIATAERRRSLATMTAADLDLEYRRLAFALSQGVPGAEKALAAIEAHIESIQRQERRAAVAAVEHQRLIAEAEQQAALDALASKRQLHADLLERREAAFVEIEAKTRALAEVVAYALIADGDVWAAAMALGYSPETRTASLITNFISAALGRSPGSGLSDMPMVLPGLRLPLATHKEP